MTHQSSDMVNPDIHESIIVRSAFEDRNTRDAGLGQNGRPGVRFVASHRHKRHQIGFFNFFTQHQIPYQIDIGTAFDGMQGGPLPANPAPCPGGRVCCG